MGINLLLSSPSLLIPFLLPHASFVLRPKTYKKTAWIFFYDIGEGDKKR